jgi:hypothetical protein
MGNGLVSRTQAFSFLDFGMTTLLDFGMVCARLGPRTRFAALRVLSIHPAFIHGYWKDEEACAHTYICSVFCRDSVCICLYLLEWASWPTADAATLVGSCARAAVPGTS